MPRTKSKEKASAVPSLPRPKADRVGRKLQHLFKHHKGDRDRLERIRGMRNLDWQVNVPARLIEVTKATGLEYRDATIAEELFVLPAMYVAEPPTLALTPMRDTPQTEGLTTRLERFTTALLFEDAGLRSTGKSTLEDMIDATFEGGAWTTLRLDRDIWASAAALSVDDYKSDPAAPKREKDEDDETYEKRKADYKPKTKYKKYEDAFEDAKKACGSPLSWLSCDALTIFPEFEGDKLVRVYEVQTRSLFSLADDYGIGLDENKKIVPDDQATIDWEKRFDGVSDAVCQFVQVWDKEWMAYYIRYNAYFTEDFAAGPGDLYEIPEYTRPHGYNLGRPPYYCSYGWTKNYERGRLATWSAAEPKRYLCEHISFLRTIYQHRVIMEAIPPIDVETPAGGTALIDPETGEPLSPAVYELGMENHLMPGASRKAMTFPGDTGSLLREIGMTQQAIHGLSPAKAPENIEGGAGFGMSVAFERDNAKYNPFGTSIKRHLTDVTIDAWKLTASLDEPVYVHQTIKGTAAGYIEVKPKDFEIAMRPMWTLHLDSTAAQIILERYLAARVQNGSLGRDQMIERLGDNVDEVNRSRAKDRVRDSEFFQQMEQAAVADEWGLTAKWASMQQGVEQLAALAGGQQQASPFMQGAPGAVPDTANLSMAPNGAGAQPGTEYQAPPIRVAGPSVPTAGATAQLSSVSNGQ